MSSVFVQKVNVGSAGSQPPADGKSSHAKFWNPFRRCRHSLGRAGELLKASPPSASTPGAKRKRSCDPEADRQRCTRTEVGLKRRKMRWSLFGRSSRGSLLLEGASDPKTARRSVRRSVSFLDVVTCRASTERKQRPYNTPSPRFDAKMTSRRDSVSRRLSTYWFETIEEDTIRRMEKSELDRQEAIYELYRGETELIADLLMVSDTYRKSMKELGLLSDDDLTRIFGHLDGLLPIHRCLVDLLLDSRSPDGTTESVGLAVVQWVRLLEGYIEYCANHAYAKDLLDARKRQPALEDFLQRCQDSPFSRRLDLWNFLDFPRSKLVKYPLLFRRIQDATPTRHDDHFYMEKAVQDVNAIIAMADRQAGRAKCEFVKEKLHYPDDKHRHDLIDKSTMVACDGVLRHGKRTKLHVFLFDKILVLTRVVTRANQVQYRVCRRPIAVTDLGSLNVDGGAATVDDNSGTCSRRRSPVSVSEQRSFEIVFRDRKNDQSFVLTADNEHDRRQWTAAIRKVQEQCSS